MSADPESISSGRSFPQWLKTKTEKKFDFDNQIASPPAYDDSFFYIRYPTGSTSNDKKRMTSGLNSISDAITTLDTKNTEKPIDKKNMVQHTEPCKQFLNNKERELIINNVKHPPKPFGTDDGFKGAGAACGSSIVRVAHQMINAKSISRGLGINNNFNKDVEEVSGEPTSSQHDSDTFVNDPMSQTSRFMIRRGSKSLPASPMGSPKTTRRNQNPYFTGTFIMATNSQANQSSTTENHSRGWFLSSLLGIQREATSTTSVASHISEEGEESLNTPKSTLVAAPKVIRAKPSELREMNFWTPTSM